MQGVVADLFHPVNRLAVELFLNGDVRHGRGWRGTVPMLLARRELDHVTRTDLLNRPAPMLREAAARRHDQRLAQRMSMPCGTRTRLKRDTRADRARRWVWLKQRVNTHRAGEPIRRTFAGRL